MILAHRTYATNYDSLTQANEETENTQRIIHDDQPYISINDVVIANVEHSTETATRDIEQDNTEEDIEIFKHSESVEVAAISLSEKGVKVSMCQELICSLKLMRKHMPSTTTTP
jgi:hypothetical protein